MPYYKDTEQALARLQDKVYSLVRHRYEDGWKHPYDIDLLTDNILEAVYKELDFLFKPM